MVTPVDDKYQTETDAVKEIAEGSRISGGLLKNCAASNPTVNEQAPLTNVCVEKLIFSPTQILT